MNVKSFFVATLSSALDLGIATPEDVLRHVTPDVLSTHLPRPLWARLLTAALGAPRVDAQLVVETIGVPNLCEHIPSPIVWACIAEIAQRSLAGIPATPIPKPQGLTAAPLAAAPATKSQPIPLATPPPEIKRSTPPRGTPLPVGPSIPKPADPLADVVAALESDDRTQTTAGGRTRTPTGPRFRQSSTGIGRLAATSARRPQAQAGSGTPAPEPTAPAAVAAAAAAAGSKPVRRGETEADAYDVETDLKDDWKNALAVEDEQLVDWTASEETMTSADSYRNKR